MEPTDVLKLRVILDDLNAERLTLPSRPETVNALIFEVKNKLNLTYLYDFRLQFQDPEFDNALCNLVNIEDLPSKASIKIVKLVDFDVSSNSTDDTVLLSDNTNSPERLCRWPEVFIIPTFSYEVEYALREGNTAFVKEGEMIKLTRDQKHNILDVMAAEIYKLKAYPSSRELGKAAEALVSKHPCLKENGSKSGYNGWKNSLRFKMDVAVNAGQRSRNNPEGAASRANIKRPRRREINFLPNYPHRPGVSNSGPRELPDMILIHQHMLHTFALRREEIVNSAPPVADLKDRWPALFCEAQDELDADHEGTVVLVAVVSEEEVPGGIPFDTRHVSIILEGQVVMSHRSWTDALVILFGLIYALHLSYPEKLSGFFEFIQIVLLNLDDGRKQLKPKLQALRNELE
uniref:Uncharacterized protein n=1 Tax=Paramormyrops kingsleyae TaxID=1676925 RepID=A0A3B3TBI3_9TELE